MVGRIDLVRRLDTQETTIIDLKSKARSQAEDVTETQLHIYALGYQQLTGSRADYVETYLLEERQAWPRSVDDDFLDDVKTQVRHAAKSLRESHLPAQPSPKTCGQCDYQRLCGSAKPGKVRV